MKEKEEVHIDNMGEEYKGSEEELPRNNNLDNTNIEENPNANESIDRSNKRTSCRLTKRTCIFIIVGAALAVLGLIILVVVISKKGGDEIKDQQSSSGKEGVGKGVEEKIEPIKKEFDIQTKEKDLKKVGVTQTSYEETSLNGEIVRNTIIRETNYYIYFLSSEDADENHRLFYSKIYHGVVAIKDECTAEGDDCEPQPLVDLVQAKNNLRNLRHLQNSEIFKDQPVALCLFDITDNNVITNFTCPKSLSYVKRNEIILDLYFFRPPAAERPDKIGDNITLDITKDKKTGETLIHETNSGYCNIYNNWVSHCTTDMNTTLDKNNNLINYDEQAYTFIRYDELNSFKKNKITKLVDDSQKIKQADIDNFEKSLNNLLPLLDPYMDPEVQFTEKDYQDLYNVIKDKKKSNEEQSYTPKKTKNTFRNLAQEKIKQIKQADIFNDRITPIQVNLALKINSGINSDICGAYAGIIFDNKEEFNFSSVEEASFVNDLLEKLSKLSKSGNSLASELYDSIYYKLEDIVNKLTIKINSLEDYLHYYDLISVFNSTLSTYSYKQLPSDIVRISNELVRSLTNILNNIKSGDIRINAEIIGNDINSYTSTIQVLIRTMLNNLATLSNTLLTKNNTFTVITNYYLNNTSSSLVNIIQNTKTILQTYFIHEVDIISPKMEELMDLIEQSNNDTLKAELASLRTLYTNIRDGIYTISSITEDQRQTVLNNLKNSLEYPFDIISKIKEYLREIMNIKSNGYFISDGDIRAFNESLNSIILEAERVLKLLDDVSIIDFVFDEIMIKFRESYINTINYMEQIKTGNFTLEEDVLNETLFNAGEKNKIENDLKDLCDHILEKIKEENDYFIQKIKEYFDKFLDDNLDILNNIIIDLNVIISEEAIQSLSNTFEIAFNLSLNKFTQITKDNINLTEKYMTHYYETILDDSALKKLLQNYYLDYTEIYRPYYDQSRTHQFPTLDIIYGKMRTSAYVSKYNAFMANLNYTEEYLKNQLNIEITNEYKQIFTQIKEELTSIVNNKLNEKFPEFYEVNFFDNHIKIIDKLNSRLDKYFSDEIFENKYKKIIEENIKNNLNLIKNIKNEVNTMNDEIKNFPILPDNTNDMCISFRRKVCYGCTNCVSYTFFYDRFCFILKPYDLNYLYLKRNIYESVNNFGQFDEVFTSLNNLVTEKVNRYNNIVESLNFNVSYIKNETLNEKITLNYLVPLSDYINKLLVEKFQTVLLKYAYNYYNSSFNGKIEQMLKDVSNRWIDAFETLSEDIFYNALGIKYSGSDFTQMAENYRIIIKTDHTENFYNSIMMFEKYELNYTVTNYYNYLIKTIDKSYNYILQKMPINENEYNELLKERKAELEKAFNNIGLKIFQSEYATLENQSNILQLEEDDYFKSKQLLLSNIEETDLKLNDTIEDIYIYEYFTSPANQYSLVMRYYLENKEYGKLIEEYYRMFNLYLDLNKFKEVMLDNWVFDSDDFVNIINKALYSTNLEIKKELFVKLEEYSLTIENAIYNEDIEKDINNLYISAIKEITLEQKNIINNYISNLLNEVRNLIKTEVNRIKSGAIYLLNKDNIKKEIKTIEENIKNSLNTSISDILNRFNENIYQNIYTNCFETRLPNYLAQARNIMNSGEYNNYSLLNSSFNIGEIIYNLTAEVINNYRNLIKKKLEIKHNELYNKIKSGINLPLLNNLIESQLDNIYQTELLPSLIQQYNCTTCSKYTFDVSTNNSINTGINTMSTNIQNLMTSLKGNNFEASFECNLDYSNSGNNVIKPLCESMKSFLSFEKEEQASRINEKIQNTIKNNLEDFLNKVVPTFGDEFFERIIDYNINFKLDSLYQNLHYAIGQTILYYEALETITKENNLPSDLKNRLINLNDLDITMVDKAYEIKESAERELNELITNLKYAAKDNYNRFLREDKIIKNSFSANIIEKINFNLEEIMPDIEREYQKSLEKYLKEKFMKDFSDSLDDKTNYMLSLFYEEKQKLKQSLDRLFSNENDEDLNAVNNKINKTIKSIQDYKNFYRNFTLNQRAKDFFINYPENKLLPIFKKFNKDLYDSMKTRIITEINNKSKIIENIDIRPFNHLINDIYNLIIYGDLRNIHNIIYALCETKEIYEEKLRLKLLEYDNNHRRRLKIGPLEVNEEFIAEENRQRIQSNYIEDTMEQLINGTRTKKNSIQTLNVFSYYLNRIYNYQYHLSIDYKNIRNKILENKYSNEITDFLLGKLTNLTNILDTYYEEIKNDLYALREDIYQSMSNIQGALDSCYNYMAIVLNKKYQDISDNTERVHKTYSHYDEDCRKTYKYKMQSENMMNTGIANILKLNESTEFNLDLTLERRKVYIPKVKAEIAIGTIPKNVVLDVITGYGFCYEKGHRFNITFNNAKYTMTIEYDTKSNYINLTTYTDIDKYKYSLLLMESRGEMTSEQISMDNYVRTFQCKNVDKSTAGQMEITVSDKKINETTIIFN